MRRPKGTAAGSAKKNTRRRTATASGPLPASNIKGGSSPSSRKGESRTATTTVGSMLHIGSRLYHARLLREARMKDVALAAGCSESLISKIESNKVVPSLRVLHRICEALNLTLGDLLGTPGESDKVVTRAQDRHVVSIDSLRTGNGIRMERLVPYTKGHLLQGNIHIIAPNGSSDGDIAHSGEEVGYVISGRIELTIDGKPYIVEAGDSFCYRSERPHGYRNIGSTEARVLFVNTPPSF